jgi:predicted ribosomally synthesized peptide with nif11-like leader
MEGRDIQASTSGRLILRVAAGCAKVKKLNPATAMSEDQLKAFQEAVKADAVLQEKLKAAPDIDSIAAIAKAAGFMISADELEAAAKAESVELSDEELESVTGGATPAAVIGIGLTAYAAAALSFGLKCLD